MGNAPDPATSSGLSQRGLKNRGPEGGGTALHFAKDVETARKLLELRADVNALNSTAQSPLMAALRRADESRLSMVREFVRANADLNLQDKSGTTALRYAVKMLDSLPLIKLLVRDGGVKVDQE